VGVCSLGPTRTLILVRDHLISSHLVVVLLWVIGWFGRAREFIERP